MDFEDAESIKSSFADNYRDFTQDPVEKCARASETPLPGVFKDLCKNVNQIGVIAILLLTNINECRSNRAYMSEFQVWFDKPPNMT